MFTGILNKHAPCRQLRIHGKTLPWISPSIRKLMKNRDHYRRKAKKSGSDADWSEYRVLRNAVTNAMRTAKLAYLEKMLGEAKSSKKMWKQVTREVGGTKQQITEVQYGGNTLT